MKIDNVYIALIKVLTSRITDNDFNDHRFDKKLKPALVYVKKRDSGYEYRDLETGLKYKTSDDFLESGDLFVDLKSLIPYRQFLYKMQQEDNDLKMNNNMAKRKMLKLFYKAQNGGKNEKGI